MPLEAMVPNLMNCPKRVVVMGNNAITASSTNKTQARNLPKGHTIVSAFISVLGSILTHSSPAGTVRENAPLEYFGNLKVRIKKELVEVSMVALYFWDAALRGQFGSFNPLTAAEVALVSTTSTFGFSTHLDFAMPGQMPEHEGAVVSSIADEAQIIAFSNAAVSDLVDSAPGATTATADMSFSLETAIHDDIPVRGYGFNSWRQLTRTDLTATASAAEIEIKEKGPLYGMVIVSRLGANRNFSNTPLSSTGTIKLMNGTEVLFERTVAQVREDMASGTLPSVAPAGVTTTGILVIPLIDMPGRRAGLFGSKLKAPTLKPGLTTRLYLPTVAGATNEFEVNLCIGRDPDELAAEWAS